jgi:hypothetical protein
MGRPNFKNKLQDPTSESSFKTSLQNQTSKSHGEITRERMKLQILSSSVIQFDRDNRRIAESSRHRKSEFLLPLLSPLHEAGCFLGSTTTVEKLAIGGGL